MWDKQVYLWSAKEHKITSCTMFCRTWFEEHGLSCAIKPNFSGPDNLYQIIPKVTKCQVIGRPYWFVRNQNGLPMFWALLFLVTFSMVFWHDWIKLVYIQTFFLFFAISGLFCIMVTESVLKQLCKMLWWSSIMSVR